MGWFAAVARLTITNLIIYSMADDIGSSCAIIFAIPIEECRRTLPSIISHNRVWWCDEKKRERKRGLERKGFERFEVVAVCWPVLDGGLTKSIAFVSGKLSCTLTYHSVSLTVLHTCITSRVIYHRINHRLIVWWISKTRERKKWLIQILVSRIIFITIVRIVG